MRLDMKARQSLVRVTAGRYQKASKKKKREILDEFVQSAGCPRCYASFLSSPAWEAASSRLRDQASGRRKQEGA